MAGLSCPASLLLLLHLFCAQQVQSTPSVGAARGSAGSSIVAMDDPAILYSPYTWAVDANAGAKTINPGAYFRVLFTGHSVILRTDTSALRGPFSQFWTRVDGGPLEQHVLSPGNPSFNISFSSTSIPTPVSSSPLIGDTPCLCPPTLPSLTAAMRAGRHWSEAPAGGHREVH